MKHLSSISIELVDVFKEIRISDTAEGDQSRGCFMECPGQLLLLFSDYRGSPSEGAPIRLQ